MGTRFSDLVFSYWGNSAATAAASRAVCGGSHLHALASRSAYPPCAGLASRPGAQRPSPYSTTPFLNAQITSCTRLCVPVFAMADDR